MSAPKTPERLWAYSYDWARHPGARIGIGARDSKAEIMKALAVTRCDDMCVASEPVEYVRADTAKAEHLEGLQALIDYIDKNAAQYESAVGSGGWAGGCAIVFAEMKQQIERVRDGGAK